MPNDQRPQHRLGIVHAEGRLHYAAPSGLRRCFKYMIAPNTAAMTSNAIETAKISPEPGVCRTKNRNERNTPAKPNAADMTATHQVSDFGGFEPLIFSPSGCH
ncbi:hypothetical protein [Curtobacterium sp. Leaf261]|uniref:hypothetical protein n=1 Tax=Curtobacterium sp. Leaf261 TaxID=1736311 RepID=UPI0012E19268|nr:hypothetical protein [Curtobacterium sp. Leaf261]